MKPVRLYNTLSRKVDSLEPLEAGKIRLYCCGPTVYNFQHIGNLRTYVFEDLLVRMLRYAGYHVTHVMNITDVGHLVSDADEGEDKMLVASRREQKTSREIAEHYTKIFFDHCALLNIRRPDIVCKATEHIEQMIQLIERLEKAGCAYQAGGNVYFDVQKFPAYGKLAKLDLESLRAGARIEVDDQKHHPLDFALWFTKSKFENQELQWDSPWGRGYPGWHIECSAMAMHYLGESFDIHCGGIDHIPVHHTNEIAQSEGATKKPFVKIWMHGGFLVTDKNKMSKSTGEFLTLDRITEKRIDPIAYRYFCLSGHYRNELSWSWEALEGAANGLDRLKRSVIACREEAAEGSLTSEQMSKTAATLLQTFESAITNDLNIPQALPTLFDTISEKSLRPEEKLRLLETFDHVLGLGIDKWQPTEMDIPENIQELLEQREQARASKNWKEADRVRDQILLLGFVVEDRKGGSPTVRPK